MECFGTNNFDNNSRLITLSTIIISGLHCIFSSSINSTKYFVRINIKLQFEFIVSSKKHRPYETVYTQITLASNFKMAKSRHVKLWNTGQIKLTSVLLLAHKTFQNKL